MIKPSNQMAKAIIILGPPATGKSTLAKKIGTDLGIAVISKDEIKELLFDSLGYADREWSKRLGSASFDLIYHSIGQMAQSRVPFVVDADFSNVDLAADKFKAVIHSTRMQTLQLNLHCDGEVLLKRFESRSANGARHPGHVDHSNIEEFRSMLVSGKRSSLPIGGEVIEIDTTDFGSVNYQKIFEKIEGWLQIDQQARVISFDLKSCTEQVAEVSDRYSILPSVCESSRVQSSSN
jgi:predicted kinase